MKPRIPLSRPFFDERENEAVSRVLASGWVVQGPEVEAFEQEIAALHQARHCIMVSSGTAALHIAYLALGIGSGDAVFIPSFAWPSAANMAVLAGARPVFVDVLPDTCNIDCEDLAKQIEHCKSEGWGRPRAIVPVHEFGLAADMRAVQNIAQHHSLMVIEDAACALGTHYQGKPVGTLGCMGIFSFHPRKSITTGEGGAIVTDDACLAEQCRLWRNHGQSIAAGKREFLLPGLNYRMTEIQAAIGRVQLAKFPAILQERRQCAAYYHQALSAKHQVGLPKTDPEHAWQTYMVVLPPGQNRESVILEMRANGVEAGPGSVAGHVGDFFHRQYGYQAGSCPVSARLHFSGLALPMYANMGKNALDTVVTTLQSLI